MEKLFTLKKGTEIADRFDGVTIPYVEADNLDHARTLAGSDENLVAIFNQAYRLNVQKHVKAIALKDDTTVEMLRERAATYKPESIRVRDPNATPKQSSGAIKEAKAKASALDALTQNPEFAAQIAAMAAKLGLSIPTAEAALIPAPADDAPKAKAKR